MAELAPRRGPLLGPRWADWAEILRGKQARVWLRMIQISLGWVEVGGHSGQKTEKKRQKPPFLARVARWRVRLLGPVWAERAKILRGEWARVWLLVMRISLGPVEVRGSNGQKTGKNRWFLPFLVSVRAATSR